MNNNLIMYQYDKGKETHVVKNKKTMKKQDRQRITNITYLNEDYYKQINKFKTNNGFLGIVFVAGSVICLLEGSRSLLNNGNSTHVLLMFFLGFVFFPVFCYLLPYYLRKRAYSKADLSEVITTDFEKDYILRTSSKNNETTKVEYTDISDLKEKGNYIVLNLKYKEPIYLSSTGFVSDTLEHVKQFLERKTELKFPSKKDKNKK